MLLKGILMVHIGLSGIAATIIWFVKSIKKTDIRNINLPIDKKERSYTSGGLNTTLNEKIEFNNGINFLEFKEAESTVLLDDFVQAKEVEETVLLEEDDRY